MSLPTRSFDVATSLNSDTAALYAGANQRVIGDLAELSIGTLKENARLLAELQMAVLETLRETQAARRDAQEARDQPLAARIRSSGKPIKMVDHAQERHASTPPGCASGGFAIRFG